MPSSLAVSRLYSRSKCTAQHTLRLCSTGAILKNGHRPKGSSSSFDAWVLQKARRLGSTDVFHSFYRGTRGPSSAAITHYRTNQAAPRCNRFGARVRPCDARTHTSARLQSNSSPTGSFHLRTLQNRTVRFIIVRTHITVAAPKCKEGFS